MALLENIQNNHSSFLETLKHSFLDENRKSALKNFFQQGFPTKKDEEYKYTNLREITEKNYNFFPNEHHTISKQQIDELHLGEENFDWIVFVNGHLHKELSKISIENVEEIAGHGLKGTIQGKEMMAGNFKLMEKFGVQHNINHQNVSETLIAVAYDRRFVGYITISDQIKEDAAETISLLRNMKVKTTMLSGDKTAVVKEVAENLGISNYFGDLLPEDKVNKLKELKSKNESVAFIGDGVNDAPVVALSDVGIAMGGLGSDATIETADVVIQDDKPSKIPVAIKIGKETKKIVWQNIVLAFGVKAIVLILGAGGLATMWEAVFADVGVALLAILNAVRIQNMKFA